MLSLLVLWWCLTIAALEDSVLIVRQTYTGPHEGPLSIMLHNGLVLKKIEWCSTLFEPRPGERKRDILDCKAPALLHAYIQSNFYTLSNKRLEISSESVGGFWLKRPASIVIRGEMQQTGQMVEQIVKINPELHGGAMPDGIFDSKMAADSPKATAYRPTTKPKPKPSVSSNTKQPVSQPLTQIQEDKEEVHGSLMSMTSLLTLVLGVGLTLMVLTIGLVVGRRKVVAQMSQPREYRSDLTFVFDQELQGKDEAERLKRQKEDLDILTRLGKGASADFYANL